MGIKFPIDLDSDLELHLVVAGITDVIAGHHNTLKNAIQAIEKKLGKDNSTDINTIDYIVKEKTIKSEPPIGKYKVTNLYVDPENGKLTVEFENTPS